MANHEIHYYVGQGSQSFGGGHGSSAIVTWVAAHFKKLTVGGQTVYDLTKPLSWMLSKSPGEPQAPLPAPFTPAPEAGK